MPNFDFKYSGYIMYFSMKCIATAEPVHMHVNKNHREKSGAKIFIGKNGTYKIAYNYGVEQRVIKAAIIYIQKNYNDIYKVWMENGGIEGFYVNIDKI